MKNTRNSLWLGLLVAFFANAQSAAASTPTMDDIRKMAREVGDGNTTTMLIPVKAEVITAEPTSSLSLKEATEAAEALAARITGAYAAVVDKSYTGYLSPAVPANAVLVIEPVAPGKAAIGDLVRIDKDGQTMIRRLLQRVPFRADATRLVVGYEQSNAREGVSEEQVCGRIVATILYDPQRPAGAVGPGEGK